MPRLPRRSSALLLGAPTARASQLIQNGGFEAGLTGWTVVDQAGGDGSFLAQTGATSPVNGLPVPAPPQGVNAAMSDAGGPGSHVLYQDFSIPVGVTAGSIRFQVFVGNRSDRFAAPSSLDFALTNRTGDVNLNQQARVDIMTTTADPFSVAAGDVLRNLYQTQVGDPLVSGYTLITADISSLLSAHAGETLRLRFAEVDNLSLFNLGVDGIQLDAVPEATTCLGACAGIALAVSVARRRKPAAPQH